MEYVLVLVYELLLLYDQIIVFVVIHSIIYYPFFYRFNWFFKVRLFFRSYKYKIYIIWNKIYIYVIIGIKGNINIRNSKILEMIRKYDIRRWNCRKLM